MDISNILNNNLVYISCFVVVAIVGLYFLIVWLTRETVKDELKKINLRRSKKKKIVQEKQKELQEIQRRRYEREQQNENPQQNDIDSYIDPAENYEQQEPREDDRMQGNQGGYSGNRLDKNDIMMRDIADGTR
jgi:FtsZ-interacting cell division protein ZipA